MAHTVSIPTRDRTGKLTPLVLEALANGATSSLDPTDPHRTQVMMFAKASEAKAFRAKVRAIALETYGEAAKETADTLTAMVDAVAVAIDAEANDPVDDTGEPEPEA